MTRWSFTMLAIVTLSAGCDRLQTSQRTIPYMPDKPIAERLLPGDTRVLVQMKPSTPPATTESFDQEIQRLRRSEIIALVQVTSSRGEVADGGTWIRTTVNADIERVVQVRSERELGDSIEFSYAGGAAKIRNVEVTTGKFPRFTEGDQYLVFLVTRPGTAGDLIWNGQAFGVDAQGVLQRMGIDGGGEQSFATNLVGKDVSEVTEALAR